MAEDGEYKAGQHIRDQGCAHRFPGSGNPKRRNLYGIGCRMAGAACPRVNQYEYLTSTGARLLRAAEKVGHGELTASTHRREMKTYSCKSYNCCRAFTKSTRSVRFSPVASGATPNSSIGRFKRFTQKVG